MAPLAIDTTSCLGLFSVLSLVLLPFSLLLQPTSPSSFWPPFHSAHSSFSTSPFFNPGSLTCFLVTTQADSVGRIMISYLTHLDMEYWGMECCGMRGATTSHNCAVFYV